MSARHSLAAILLSLLVSQCVEQQAQSVVLKGTVVERLTSCQMVFPFEMKLTDAAKVGVDLDSGVLKAFLVHVGEAKPTYAASAREF